MSGIESLLTGRMLVKRYRIQEVIGRGGFAAVYRADDERLGRPVAVKVITLTAPDEEARRHIRERFDREARAAAALPHHPNVVTVHDYGTDPELGLDFLVMELLQGEDLATHLARKGRPPTELALRILREATEGIAVGHRARLVHRDVKPGNIFLAEPHGGEPFRVCVLDFGIARIATDDGAVTQLTGEQNPLSPAYASPEQLRGERDLTPASDVYSLGVVGHQLLTGTRPSGPAEPGPVRAENPEVPAEVEALIRRATAQDPAERFRDADALAEALDDVMGGGDRTLFAPPAAMGAGAAAAAAAPLPRPDDDHTVLQPAPAPPPPTRPAPRVAPARRSSAIPAGLIAVLLLGVAAGAWWLFAQDADRRGAAPPAGDDTAVVVPVEPGPEPGPAPPPADPAPAEPPADPAEPEPLEPAPADPVAPDPVQPPPPMEPAPTPPPTAPPPPVPPEPAPPPQEPPRQLPGRPVEPAPPPARPPTAQPQRPPAPSPQDTIRIPSFGT
jgi:eukaryotic-like serine/threonine-protein kinase